MKHSKPPAGKQLDQEVEKIVKNPKILARWVALLRGVQIIDSAEERWKIPQDDENMDGLGLIDFINETAPMIEEEMAAGFVR